MNRPLEVQDHVHARQAAGSSVFLLSVQRDIGAGCIAHLEKQGARATGGIIDGCAGSGFRLTNAYDLRHNATDLSGGVELALALATLGGEVPHEVFVGIAQDVIAVGTVLGEVERLILKDRNEVGEPFHHLLAAAKLGGIVEVRHIREFVGVCQWADDLPRIRSEDVPYLEEEWASVGLTHEGKPL